MTLRSNALALTLLVTACGPSDTTPDDTGGHDVPSSNDATHDVATDTGTGTDTGPIDDLVDSGGIDDTGPDDSGPTDSGPRDSGPVDSGPRDGGPTDGGNNCAGLRYCDDFEAYDGPIANGAHLGPWTASVGGVTPTARVDTMRAHHGTHALHITVPAGDASHAVLHQAAAAGMGLVPSNNVFGRAMVYYANTGGNDLPIGVHSWLFQATGTSTPAHGNVSMNMGGGGAAIQLNYHPPSPRTEASVHGGTITAGAWHCLQWQYNGSGTAPANTAKVWLDGTMVDNVPASMGWDFATPWNAFDFGFTHYQTLAHGVDVFLDEFALNDAMIPCP